MSSRLDRRQGAPPASENVNDVVVELNRIELSAS
jgi:hypothetical protein